MEVLIISTILRSQKINISSRDKQSISVIFAQAGEKPELAKGLQYFLKKTVSKTDIAGTQADKETVRWGCKVARDALDATNTLQAIDQ